VQFVEQVSARYEVDPERIYLVGFSMGGYGTWHVAADYPTMFAAIAPICGGGQPKDAEALAHLPTWAFHGAKDEVVPVTESERMIQAMRAAGGAPKLTVFPDAGHGICNNVCDRSDFWSWLLLQKLGTIAVQEPQ
jgi:predicted peptidase